MKRNRFTIKALIGAFLIGVCITTGLINILKGQPFLLIGAICGIVGGVMFIIDGVDRT